MVGMDVKYHVFFHFMSHLHSLSPVLVTTACRNTCAMNVLYKIIERTGNQDATNVLKLIV